MGEDSRALWEALGRPVEGLPLPTAHSPAWRTARNSLRTALAAAGAPSRVRSPRALGLLLRGIPPGPGETWGSHLTGCGWSELCRALRTGNSAAGLRLASWNLRWMVSPHTAQNAAKRNAIRQWLEAGRTVLLQETHWSPEDQAVWGARFPAAQLFAAPAVQGPRGGPREGWPSYFPWASELSHTGFSSPGVPWKSEPRSRAAPSASFPFTCPRATTTALLPL